MLLLLIINCVIVLGSTAVCVWCRTSMVWKSGQQQNDTTRANDNCNCNIWYGNSELNQKESGVTEQKATEDRHKMDNLETYRLGEDAYSSAYKEGNQALVVHYKYLHTLPPQRNMLTSTWNAQCETSSFEASNHLPELPSELLYTILASKKCLDYKDLCSCALVSKKIKTIADNEDIWREQCCNVFQIDRNDPRPKAGWKQLYK